MNLLFTLLQVLSIALQAVLVLFLLWRFLKRYAIILIYCLLQLSATVVAWLLWSDQGRQSVAYRNFYWTAEVALDLTLFLAVILLTYQALEGSKIRPQMGRLLGGVVIFALALPFVLLRGPVFGNNWFNHASQMLTFGAALLNLGLWTALLTNRKRDPLLLKVSVGLGIAMTGAAIAYGMRELFVRLIEVRVVDLFASATHVAGVFIWCWAFWPKARRRVPPANAVTTLP
jgi:hypothetical protein